MSWTLSIPTKTPREQFDAAIDAATATGNEDVLTERDEQVRVAKEAAKSVVAEGAVGFDTINCSINGHANPEHKPREGWANDTITINLSSGGPAQP